MAAASVGQVSLRAVIESDLPIFYEHQRDAKAVAMADFPSRERDAHMLHWHKIMAEPANTMRTVLWNGEVAGNIVSWDASDGREVGYWIGREFWGRGIATRALQLFLQRSSDTTALRARGPAQRRLAPCAREVRLCGNGRGRRASGARRRAGGRVHPAPRLSCWEHLCAARRQRCARTDPLSDSPEYIWRMPELPELEVVRDVLQRRVVGQTITAAALIPPGGPIVARDLTHSGFETGLAGARIQAVQRRGKFLIFTLGVRREAALPGHQPQADGPTSTDWLRRKALGPHTPRAGS